ncbi:MAG: asparagine synthetase B, partial [Alphaproteobacteria bacterium]|nr:asparagine synthetase B [Alphaproteobacteria bacterium]
MCGIVGFTQPGRAPERVLRAMMAPIVHRGPDQDGIWVDDAIAVGHLRLTIIDLVGGQQPRIDPDTGDLLVFNGELYDFREHAKALEARGVRLRDASDTEVLFQMLRLDGVEATLARIDGMFAFAYRDG